MTALRYGHTNIIAPQDFEISLLQTQRKNDMAQHSHLHWVQCPGQYLSPYWQFIQRVENHLKCYIIQSRHKLSFHLPWSPFLPVNSMSMIMANNLEPGYHNLLVLPFRLWVLLAHYHAASLIHIHCTILWTKCQHIHWNLVVVSALVQSHHQSIQIVCSYVPFTVSFVNFAIHSSVTPSDPFFFSFLISAFI